MLKKNKQAEIGTRQENCNWCTLNKNFTIWPIYSSLPCVVASPLGLGDWSEERVTSSVMLSGSEEEEGPATTAIQRIDVWERKGRVEVFARGEVHKGAGAGWVKWSSSRQKKKKITCVRIKVNCEQKTCKGKKPLKSPRLYPQQPGSEVQIHHN